MSTVERTCAVCKSVDNLKSCASCSQRWYCGRQHQIEDWKLHKSECNRLAELKANQLTNNMAQLVVKPKKTQHPMTVVEPASVGTSLPAGLPSHITKIWLQKTASNVIACLNKFGFALLNDFLGAELGERILQEAKSMDEQHLMADGQTTQDPLSKQKYRMDKIVWVRGDEEYCTDINTLVLLIDNLMQLVQLKFPQHKIQGRTKAMVACYPGEGSRYVKHIDNPSNDGRLVTCIYYLNKDWNCEKDGGMLKIYPQGTDKVASIEPLMDRLVIFWSDKRNPHEVLPAYRTRFAITAWYFDSLERTAALKKGTDKRKASDPSHQTDSKTKGR